LQRTTRHDQGDQKQQQQTEGKGAHDLDRPEFFLALHLG
jgi:hypothetical protein